MVEHRSPKPGVGGSNPSTPAKQHILTMALVNKSVLESFVLGRNVWDVDELPSLYLRSPMLSVKLTRILDHNFAKTSKLCFIMHTD